MQTGVEEGGGVEAKSHESVCDDVSHVVTVNFRLDGRVVDVESLHHQGALWVICHVTKMSTAALKDE